MTEEQGRTEQDQLVVQSQETALALKLQRELEMNETVDTIAKALFNKVNAMKGNGNGVDKHILAINSLFKREENQLDNYPLMGLQDAIPSSLDTSELASNGLITSADNMYNQRTVYVLVKPVENLITGIETEEDVSGLESLNKVSPTDKIEKAIQPFIEEDVVFELRVYIDCDTYTEYKSTEKEVEEYFESKLGMLPTVNDSGCTLKLISEYKNARMFELAEKPVDKFPSASADITSIVDEFYSTFDLVAYRRKKVYFNFRGKEIFNTINNTDFLLLSYSKLRNLLIDETAVSSLAKAYTKFWLELGSNYKHKFEEIEDFFNTQTAVSITGLSPVFGVIVGRKILLKGRLYDLEKGTESNKNLELTSISRLGAAFDYEELKTLMLKDSRNLMTNMVKIDGQYLRVDSMVRTLYIQGKNRNSLQESSKFVLEEDFENLTFLTPYYYVGAYEQLGRFVNAVPYHLPERFSEYLKRKASMSGHNVANFYPNWFTPRNAYLSEMLNKLSERIKVEDILEHSISPIHGLIRDELIVPIGGSRNVIKG